MNPVQYYTGQGWRVTSPYGNRWHPLSGEWKHHNGIDFGDKPAGYPVRTPYPGIVTLRQFIPSRGNTVVMRITPRVLQLCQHLQSFQCKVGDSLPAGAVVGLNGSTGDSTGPHLHYELHVNDGSALGYPVWGDPAKFEMEVFELKIAIVVNDLVDVLAVEPLAKKLDAPIFLRGSTGQLNAETVIVAGGDADAFKKAGVKVINLSGADRWGTATLVGEYYRGVK